MVAFDWSSTDPRAHGLMARLARVVSPTNASLPDTYGMTATDLAQLMQAWRDRWSAG